MKPEKLIISILVQNNFGVLTRVSSLFSRRGFNIDSLTVGETHDPKYSRMTITTTGDEYIKDQMIKQLAKLYEVKEIQLMSPDSTVTRELMLVKINAEGENRTKILDAITVFKAKAVDLTPETIGVEITGELSKLNAFLEYVKPYGIIDLCRTGITAMGRGDSAVTYDICNYC